MLEFTYAHEQCDAAHLVFPTRVFPEPESRFFSTTKPGYIKNPGIAVAFKY